MLIERWSPRHQLKPYAIVDHRKAPRSKCHPLTIDAGDIFTCRGWPVNKACAIRNGTDGVADFLCLQLVEHGARKDELLTLSPRQPACDQLVSARSHRVADLAAISVTGNKRFLRHQLPVKPGGSIGCHLCPER